MENNQGVLSEISRIARDIKEGREDVIVGLREIFGLWSISDLKRDKNYNALNGIVSETDLIIKGEIQKNFSEEYIENQKKEEREYIEKVKPFINKLLDELCKIPIVEDPKESENPYAWPFDKS